MSYDKEAKALNRFHSKRVISKRVFDWNNYPHNAAGVKHSNKWNKRNPFNCGVSGCYMCCNPRRTFGRLTIQELKANDSFGYAFVTNLTE